MVEDRIISIKEDQMCQHCIEKQIEKMIIAGFQDDKIIKILAEVRQDISLPILEDLKNRGFNKVIWHTSDTDYAMNDICSTMNNKEWELEEFIYETHHDAPIFSKSHVQCMCEIECINSQSGESIRVNYNGVV